MRGVSLLVLLIALAMVGCGGDSTKSVTQVQTQRDEEPPSKARYIEVGDVICKNHQSRREDLESQTIDLGQLTSESKAHQVAELLREQSNNLRAEADELEALRPPPADVDTATSIVSLVRAKAAVIDRWAGAYDDLNTAEIRTLQVRIGVVTARARDAARAFGFEVCGQE